MGDEEIIFHRMFMAVPELKISEDYIEFGRRNGYLTDDEAAAWKTVARKYRRSKTVFKKMATQGTVLQRVQAIMPEILSVRTIDMLRKVRIDGNPLISTKEANAMRAVLLGARSLRPVFAPETDILRRSEAVLDAVTNSAVVNFLRNVDTERLAAQKLKYLHRQDLRREMREDPNSPLTLLSPKGLDDLINTRIGQGILPLSKMLNHRTADGARWAEALENSVRRAQQARAAINSVRLVRDTARLAAAQRTVWGAVTLVLDQIVGYGNGDRMLKNAVRAGVIAQEHYQLIRHVELYGFDIWRKISQARRYESWAARSLIVSEGMLSDNMVKALREYGLFGPKNSKVARQVSSRLMRLSRAVRAVTRNRLMVDHMRSATFRVIPGESPLKTFARISQTTDREMLGLLAQAAKETEDDIARLAARGGFGNLTRANQQRSLLASVHTKMREVYEDVGSLTIFGERAAAQAALTAETALLSVYEGAGSHAGMRSLRASARAGLDNWISRHENLKQLSTRVYGGINILSGQIERRINTGLIRGLSARELAASVAGMIRPDVPGGVSYAAMRLARTEINNAFHFSQIRYTREMPWVEGYKWNISGSHPRTDVCNDMAEDNHDGLGRGVYHKRNVPGKPHPQCLCFLTNAMVDNKTFNQRLRSGAYNAFIDKAVGQDTISFSKAGSTTEAFKEGAADLMTMHAGASVLQDLQQYVPGGV